MIATLGAVLALSLAGPAAAGISVGATSTPQTTTSQVFPTTAGNSTFYEYTLTDGQSLTDSIPVQFCITGQASTSWTSFQVAIQPQGSAGNLSVVTLPGRVTFSPPDSFPVCRTVSIGIATAPLTLADPTVAQQFSQNLNIVDVSPMPSNGPDKPQVNWTGSTEIHIRVLVNPVAANNISCFTTDSSGNFLTKCDGSLADQSGTDAGRFSIVANRKGIETATNPGQFYYNLLYVNHGSDPVTVDVSFVRNGVNTKGTQAIHAALFAPPFSGYTVDGFNEVNESIPEGADDQVSGITIPAGWTLWVDYHLEWNGLGGLVPTGCATGCATANQGFSVTGTVTETGGHTEACTTGAWGYRK